MHMEFGRALQMVRAAHRIRRDGWPEGTYVVHQDGYPQGIPINANTARATGEPEGTVLAFRPYLMQHIPRAGFVPWTPNQIDILAFDWTAEPAASLEGPQLPAEAF